VTAAGASVFRHPVWPRAYHNFVHALDHDAWVCKRLSQADFVPVGVPAWGPASYFIRHVLAHVDESCWAYVVPVDQRDNVLAMLTLLHMPVQCVVEPHGGDDDGVVEEVSTD
jgi:hypothetical protein